jgi:hypothetical protein
MDSLSPSLMSSSKPCEWWDWAFRTSNKSHPLLIHQSEGDKFCFECLFPFNLMFPLKSLTNFHIWCSLQSANLVKCSILRSLLRIDQNQQNDMLLQVLLSSPNCTPFNSMFCPIKTISKTPILFPMNTYHYYDYPSQYNIAMSIYPIWILFVRKQFYSVSWSFFLHEKKQTTVIPSCQENIPLEWKFHAENNTFLIAVLDIDQFRSIQSMSSGKVFTKFELTLEAFAFIHAPTPLCHQYPLTQTKVLPRSMMQTSNIYWSWLNYCICWEWFVKHENANFIPQWVWLILCGVEKTHNTTFCLLSSYDMGSIAFLNFILSFGEILIAWDCCHKLNSGHRQSDERCIGHNLVLFLTM